MVKAHSVIITAQVDMNLIVVCDGVTAVDDDDDERIRFKRDTESPVCIVLMREAMPIPC